MRHKDENLSHNRGRELEGAGASAQSLLRCLEYLCCEAQGAGFDLAAHLIGAAAEAVRAESHLPRQGDVSHDDVVRLPVAPWTR